MNALVYDNVVAYSRLAISSSTRFPTHLHDHPLVPILTSVLPRLQRVCTPYTHTSHCISNYHTTSNGTTTAEKLPTISLPHRFPNLCFSPLHDTGAAQDKILGKCYKSVSANADIPTTACARSNSDSVTEPWS